MLTVKLVEPSGFEQIWEVKDVWVSPYDSPAANNGFREVTATRPDGEVLGFGSYGSLFVMNDHGATLARYHLGDGVETPKPIGDGVAVPSAAGKPAFTHPAQP